MALVTGLIERTLILPLSVSTNSTLMSGLLSQVTSLLYTDTFGAYSWFVNHYTLDPTNRQEVTVVRWVMTSTNDTTFMTTILPGMLTQAGLSGIQTYTTTVSASY